MIPFNLHNCRLKMSNPVLWKHKINWKLLKRILKQSARFLMKNAMVLMCCAINISKYNAASLMQKKKWR